MVPKHTGTDRMVSQVRKQMAALRGEIEERRLRGKAGRPDPYSVLKTGAAQVVLVGPTNAGRSSILRAVTGAQVEVTPYPFGTRVPVPGMLRFEDIQFQLVEVPALIRGSGKPKPEELKRLGLIRGADGIAIVVDLQGDPVGDFLQAADELMEARILLAPPEGEVEITKTREGGGIRFVGVGRLDRCTPEKVIELLEEFKVTSAMVHLSGRVTLQDVEDAIFGGPAYRPTIILANKSDLGADEEKVAELREAAEPIEVVVCSAEKPEGLQEILGGKLFNLLKIARIYTKEAGGPPNRVPVVARDGVTVGELAQLIHNDFYENFKYARIWGPSAKFPEERVGRDRALADGTVIQLYA